MLPGDKKVETKSPGLLFVMLSRIKTLRALAISEKMPMARLHAVNTSAHNMARVAEKRHQQQLESLFDVSRLPSFADCVRLVRQRRRLSELPSTPAARST